MSKKLQLGILLSGSGRTMVNLQQCIDRGELNAKIVCVISSRSNVAGVDRARQIGLEPVVVRKIDFATEQAFSDRITEVFDNAQVELVLMCGFLCRWLLPKRYDGKVMNIHPALLPDFGGKGMWGHHVHKAVLNAGCKESGCTVHWVTNQYDSGPIILQRKCQVKDHDDPDSLAARVFEQECLAYPEAVRQFAKNIRHKNI